ncbi:MAG: membrane-associated protein [Gammaproteobacteria bacterium]|nr:membrane-associated protein [Gammaproteobacteria bacterium]MDH3362414.1 membrane-associated protein [Gammaproteobacteria bacterium]MDH3481420.1 membrane-associated protein [Gammaproteobacteria bacterium]
MGDELLVSTLVPLWLKIAWTAMVLVIVIIYWWHRGPANFLWFSDIALLALVPGLWLESSFIVSLMACMVFVPEILWGVSFFGRLLHLPRVIGLADYMFDEPSPLWLRAVSLFHVPLLAVIVWGTWRLGYDPGVYPWAVLIAWLVLPLTRWLTEPEDNINHVYELPVTLGVKLTPVQHMLVQMTAAALLLQLPGHLLLRALSGN